MIRLAIILTLALIIVNAPAYGQTGVYVTTATTGDIVRACNAKSNLLEENFCTGYIMGTFDAMSFSSLVCPPVGFSTEQALAIAEKYLNNHPERWHLHPSFLIATAFKEAFPCASVK